MATTLLLQLAGPLQSWGTRSRFEERETERAPSKSGVLGLICSALGRSRDSAITDLAALKMGVRVDRPGVPLRDFHTAQNHLDGQSSQLITDETREQYFKDLCKSSPALSKRYYLSDAVFLVGLEGSSELLTTLQKALRSPRWALFLGRKSCPPSRSVFLPDGLRSESLEPALKAYPWLGGQKARKNSPDKLLLSLEVSFEGEGSALKDQPLSYAQRTFLTRKVQHQWVPRPYEEAPCL